MPKTAHHTSPTPTAASPASYSVFFRPVTYYHLDLRPPRATATFDSQTCKKNHLCSEEPDRIEGGGKTNNTHAITPLWAIVRAGRVTRQGPQFEPNRTSLNEAADREGI